MTTRLGIRIGMLALVLAALAVLVLGAGRSDSASAGPGNGPAKQEVSLAQAASSPSGLAAGQQPASAVGSSGVSRADTDPAAVLGDPHDEVVGNGCHADYGTNGQCLPAVPPTHEGHDPLTPSAPNWTCTAVRGLFPNGIAVRVPGTDPLGLDTDGDGTACDLTDGG